MAKPTLYPERIEFHLPLGTKARLATMLGIDPGRWKSGMAGSGPRLREWLLGLLEKAELGLAADPVASCENVAMLDVAAVLLSDPDEEVRSRVVRALENCRDFQERRRRKAAGEVVTRLEDLRVRPEDLRALVKKSDAGGRAKAA